MRTNNNFPSPMQLNPLHKKKQSPRDCYTLSQSTPGLPHWHAPRAFVRVERLWFKMNYRHEIIGAFRAEITQIMVWKCVNEPFIFRKFSTSPALETPLNLIISFFMLISTNSHKYAYTIHTVTKTPLFHTFIKLKWNGIFSKKFRGGSFSGWPEYIPLFCLELFPY